MSIKDEAVEAAKRIRDTAMQQTLAARIPESGHFGAIAQDADWLVDHLTAALPHMGEVRNGQLRAIQNSTLYQCSSCLDHYPEGSCYPADEVWALGDKVLCDECLDNEADGDSAIRIDKALASHEPAPKPEGEPKVWIIDKSNVSAAVAAIVERAKRGEIADSPPKTGREPQELSEFLSSSEPAKDGPEVVGWRQTDGDVVSAADMILPDKLDEPLVRLSDYEALRAERDAALEAEDEAKDCFWAIYPDWVEMKGHGISTEAARTKLSERIGELEELLHNALTANQQEVERLTRERDEAQNWHSSAVMGEIEATQRASAAEDRNDELVKALERIASMHMATVSGTHSRARHDLNQARSIARAALGG